ncbi:MAG: hypothetical protein KDC25_12785 [Saprospiraceae bacterium]|jgi:mannose-6-phosphate isomerase|nr:hypothetical protein [Saprospiraceae bacterium]
MLTIHSDTKQAVFDSVESYLKSIHFAYRSCDDTRPWGGFFTFEESLAQQFIEQFYADTHIRFDDFPKGASLSPKLLIVAPNKRLSWQYHFRRAEVWRCIFGDITVVTSDTDEEKDRTILSTGEIVQLEQGERHRIIGNEGYGIVAEIWQHIDPNHPSDEDDIVRLQDDFGRK